jgi:transposase-like protein
MSSCPERFRLIAMLADRFPMAWLCKQMGLVRSGFYAWRQKLQNPGCRAPENAALTTQVQAAF